MATEPPRAKTLSALLDDVEEALSGRIGDIAAHRLIGALRGVGALQADAARRLAEGVMEYALEEQPLLVSRAGLEALAAGIRRLGERVDQLDARIERLSAER